MGKCAVLFCKNYSGITKNVSFHAFPVDPQRKRKWVEAVRREETWIPTKHHRICSIHFQAECYNINAIKQRKLHKDSLPTLNLPKFSRETEHDTNISENLEITKKEMTVNKPRTPVNPPDALCDHDRNKIVDTPRKPRLKRKVQEQNRKIKRLQHHNRRLTKKVASLEEILDNLTKKSLITDEDKILLEKIGGKTKDLLIRMKTNIDTGKVPRAVYSPELKTFALTLHFYSARAYKYVRKVFNTCLPAPRTLQKWYSNIDGKPGFTSEALKAIKERVGAIKVYGALIIDEMKIMESEEAPPNTGRTFGFEDYGFMVESDGNRTAREVLVFLLVALNEAWKIPIAYFATYGANADQKSSLILTAVNLVQESGVEIKSVIFDGPRTNLSTAKKLGCVLDPNNLKTYFTNPINGNRIYIFLDPCHMLKNIRNAFQAYGLFQDSEDRQIKWQFLEDLHRLQENELFHLANKLRANHIYFKTKIMNVRLASQLFSQSVADALMFCETELHILNFSGVQATADFIKVINDLFDILDSRTHQYGYKRALNMENHEQILNMLDKAKTYLTTLKYDGASIMDSYRYTGFLGFCVCAESAKGLFNDLILPENEPMQYLPLHKISQDHLEIFFGNVRSHGGRNDNPTVRLFESIYKKMLVHLELMDVETGNCVPLEKLTILHCSSTSPVDRINKTTARRNSDRDDFDVMYDDFTSTSDLDVINTPALSPFVEKVVEYIAGFVAHKLIKKLKCDTCITALLSDALQCSLISQKDRGKLIYPSEDTITICRCCESELRKGVEDNKLKKEYSTAFLLPQVCSRLQSHQLFQAGACTAYLIWVGRINFDE